MTSPFAHLARTHAASAAGDALIAVALASSLFFSIDPSGARWRVGLYLLLTVAPFAVVAPLIGPVMDRAEGGRRWMIVGTCVGRLVVAGFMIRDLDSLLLFPEAFAMLVMGKGYHVAKSAVVPSMVRDESELVHANSKLQLSSALAGIVGGAPGLLLNKFVGAPWTVALAAVVFGLATASSMKIPATTVAAQPADADELATLRSGGIRLASWAMGLMRGVVGFMTFLLAFTYRSTVAGSTDYRLGVVLAASVIGALCGAIVAPRVRLVVAEERMLVGALTATAVVGAIAAFIGGLIAAALMAFTVGIAAAAAKLAFDAIVQRDAPTANQGRSFAKFESRFQLMWVVGAVIPVGLPIIWSRWTTAPLPAWIGYLVIVAAAVGGLVWYVLGTRHATTASSSGAAGQSRVDPTDPGPGTGSPFDQATTTPFEAVPDPRPYPSAPPAPIAWPESPTAAPTVGTTPDRNLFDQGPGVFDQAEQPPTEELPIVRRTSTPPQVPPAPRAAPEQPEFEETRAHPVIPSPDE